MGHETVMYVNTLVLDFSVTFTANATAPWYIQLTAFLTASVGFGSDGMT